MSRLRTFTIAAAAAFAVVGLAYVLPTVAELRLMRYLGATTTIILLGDAIGCAALALIDWKKALALLVIMDVVELWAIRSSGIRAEYLVFFCDAIPAVLLASIAANKTADLVLLIENHDTRN